MSSNPTFCGSLRPAGIGPPGRRRRCAPVLGALAAVLVLAAVAGPTAAQPTAPLAGWLHVMWGDGVAGPTSAAVLIDDADRWHRLRIDRGGLDARALHRLRGRRVTVTGPRMTISALGAAAADGSTIDVEDIRVAPDGGAVASAAARDGTVSGAQPWITILCRFADSRGVTPRPRSYFEALMGDARPGLGHYWREASYGRVSLAGSAVAGWYDLPAPRAAYVYAITAGGEERLDFQRTAQDCAGAAAADVTLADFAGINLMFNETLDCCSWGGSAALKQGGVTRTYRATWMPPWAYVHQYVVAHEMGHGFGLPHSSGPYGNPYDSDWDPMSGGGRCAHPDPTFGCLAVHTIAHHKDLLGWLASETKLTPAPGAAAGFVLERLAKPRSASYLMAEIPIPGSRTRSYTLEARLPAGYDKEIPGPGVVVHEVDTARDDRPARVVDTDANGDPNDAGAMWLPGEAFVDAASDISVFVDGATPTGFQVMVLTSGVRLAARRAGDGTGRVTSDPAGIDCGATCAAAWPRGTAVRLRAQTEPPSVLAGWTGCDTVTGADCRVTLSGHRTVSAQFSRPVQLSVAVYGSGLVTSVPAGIDCGATCAARYASGTAVALRATPAPGSAFAGFTGSADCADGALTLTSDAVCTAAFRPLPNLVVKSLSSPPAALAPGAFLAVTDTVVNKGAGAAGPFGVRYYLSTDTVPGGDIALLLGRRSVSGLAAGAATTATTLAWVPAAIAPGTYYVLACADDTGAVIESNESNNCRAAGPLAIRR